MGCGPIPSRPWWPRGSPERAQATSGNFTVFDGQVAQGGHGLGSAAGADLGGVFAVADVAEVVQGLDLPVAADPGGELGGGCLVGVQAGDRVDGDGPPPPAVQRPDLAGEAEGLGGVREGEPDGDGRGLEGAVLLAAMAPVVLPGWFFLTIRM
jgi:hypothetical protein